MLLCPFCVRSACSHAELLPHPWHSQGEGGVPGPCLVRCSRVGRSDLEGPITVRGRTGGRFRGGGEGQPSAPGGTKVGLLSLSIPPFP